MKTRTEDIDLLLQQIPTYIDEADALLEQFARACEDCLVPADPDSTGVLFRVSSIPDVPQKLALPIRAVVQNVRSALDYLVYQLAELDAGATVKGTQFPITHSRLDFEKALERYNLAKMSQAHVDALEELQPYKIRERDKMHAPDWLTPPQILQELSNVDKHRHLTRPFKHDFVSGMIRPEGPGCRLPDGSFARVNGHQAIVLQVGNYQQVISSVLWTVWGFAVDAVGVFRNDLEK